MTFNPGDKFKLKIEIVSNHRKKQMAAYGKAGDEVILITANHYPVMLVKNKKGEGFPVRIEQLEKVKNSTLF